VPSGFIKASYSRGASSEGLELVLHDSAEPSKYKTYPCQLPATIMGDGIA